MITGHELAELAQVLLNFWLILNVLDIRKAMKQ